MSAGPYLILAAFWSAEDVTDAVAEALHRDKFPGAEGYPRGAVVSFRREVATQPAFLHDLGRFDLSDLRP